ncbi:hypothetical protein [Ruegeria sp.]|uniref:hypothetical protein n=1 Tax=Ruegeria sp. TaxID=1879320 RepID=UPI003AFFFE76
MEAQLMETHWTERWIGHRAEDCAALVSHVLRVEFGSDIALPAAPGGIRANDAAIRDALMCEAGRKTGCTTGRATEGGIARRLGARERACDGDGVLMRARGRRAGLGHHIGLYADMTEPACLHWQPGLGTVLHRLRILPARGLVVVGLYRWETGS